MAKKIDYVKEIMDKAGLTAVEAEAAMEQSTFPSETPNQDLPNLKRDRIVLDLINRTNSDATIDLLGMPSGVNYPQGIRYGNLFETYYCEMRIPQAELGTTQTYDINWIDESGTNQSATTAVVSTISALISELIIVTNDNWGYYEDGTDYIVHKLPIDTFVY
jgi:hypothetical protein